MFIKLCFILFLTAKLNQAEKIYPPHEARESLLKNILKGYHTTVRPNHGNETLMLFVNIEIQHFDFCERTGAFQLLGLLHVKWRDPKLVWNPQIYGNMSHILISQKYIWIPDLEFYNNAPDKFIRMHHNGLVSVKSDGVVFWSDTIEINAFCSQEMKNWPHDKHNCKMKLGSWTYHGLEVDFMHLEPNSSMTFNSIEKKNMEFKITKFNASHVTIRYSCCDEPYISLNYDITFERQSSYMVIFHVPALTVILFTLVALRMDPDRREKLWLNGLSFILITWQLLCFARNAEHFHGTPNIVIFFSTCLVLVTFAQLLAVFSLFVTHSMFKGHLPKRIERFSYAPFIMFLVRIGSQNEEWKKSKQQFMEVKMDDTSNLIDQNILSNDWLRFAKILNILAFLVFSIIFLVTTIVIV